MRLRLISYTPDIETIIATALLTTSNPSSPLEIYRRLSGDPERVRALLDRVELHHGTLLEHNKLCWLLEASKDEVLELLIKRHYFYATPLGESRWLLSSNLRMALTYAQRYRDQFSEALIETLRDVVPNLIMSLGRGQS